MSYVNTSSKTFIVVQTSFEASHRYPTAPKGVEFLSQTHRHMFHVRANISVSHDDRELEFILVKRYLTELLDTWDFDLGSMSCEMMAKEIIGAIEVRYGANRIIEVSVFEDGENGAVVEQCPS